MNYKTIILAISCFMIFACPRPSFAQELAERYKQNDQAYANSATIPFIQDYRLNSGQLPRVGLIEDPNVHKSLLSIDGVEIRNIPWTNVAPVGLSGPGVQFLKISDEKFIIFATSAKTDMYIVTGAKLSVYDIQQLTGEKSFLGAVYYDDHKIIICSTNAEIYTMNTLLSYSLFDISAGIITKTERTVLGNYIK